jgi:hypothetical protein
VEGRRKPVTAEELISELDANPDFRRRRAAAERERAAAAAEFSRCAEPVKAALRAAGLPDAGFGTFVSARGAKYFGEPEFDHQRAVPILLEWLPRIDDLRVKEAVVRHLSTKYAKPVAAQPLVEEFRRTPTDQEALKWAIGNALDVVADNSVVPELLELAREQQHGSGRQMIVRRLGRAPKQPEIVETLAGLLEDEDVALHAMSALRQQLGPAAARPHIARLQDHSSELIRTQARRELKKLDRVLAKKSERQ